MPRRIVLAFGKRDEQRLEFIARERGCTLERVIRDAIEREIERFRTGELEPTSAFSPRPRPARE